MTGERSFGERFCLFLAFCLRFFCLVVSLLESLFFSKDLISAKSNRLSSRSSKLSLSSSILLVLFSFVIVVVFE